MTPQPQPIHRPTLIAEVLTIAQANAIQLLLGRRYLLWIEPGTCAPRVLRWGVDGRTCPLEVN